MPTAIQIDPISLDSLSACDLAAEVSAMSPLERAQTSAYRVIWADIAQPAQVLLCGHTDRAAIFDGADSWWCDAETIEEALAAYAAAGDEGDEAEIDEYERNSP